VAAASWDTTSLAEGYHQITLRATDSSGSFEKQAEVKVSDTDTVSVSDLTSHLETYQGSYASLEGTVVLGLIGPRSFFEFQIPEGMALLIISDSKDMAVVIAGECFSPPLSEVKRVDSNDQVIVKVVPVRLSMEFVASTELYDEYYSKIGDYINSMPASAREKDAQGKWVAVWGARWLSSDDLTILPG
jgi:hypothetical protein